ncbi:MAG: CHAT domain-containing protein [Candidatus Aminicenantes bacterium]|nr:MAG: CHAT domain-containing protein [Candidatus Aminicenantes bacterium]
MKMKKPRAPVISVVYADNNWEADFPEVEIDKKNIKEYMAFLKRPVFLDYIIKVGLKLKRALLPVPGDSSLPSLMGVRSTSIYHRIPLDALPLSVNKQTGAVTHWLGEKMTSVLLTGQNKDLSILEKQLSIEKIALFANSDFDGKFRHLKGTKMEAKSIEDIIKTKTNTFLELFLESDSNRNNFLQLSGRKAPQIMHISTHGITSEENPSSGFIALSNKDSRENPILGAVGYHDIMLMDLRQCDLVVLSACSTHEGKSILGEGIMGLAWAFKAAGARAVIGTRWPVNDESAVEFWKKFYENLFAGLPIGKAFQGARMHIMKQEKWRHPFYWGVFQLIV